MPDDTNTILLINEIHSSVKSIKTDLHTFKKEMNKRISKLEEQRMSDIKIHSKFESDFVNHEKADDVRFESLEKNDEKIVKKLEALSPLVYKAGVVFTIVMSVIMAALVKVLVG